MLALVMAYQQLLVSNKQLHLYNKEEQLRLLAIHTLQTVVHVQQRIHTQVVATQLTSTVTAVKVKRLNKRALKFRYVLLTQGIHTHILVTSSQMQFHTHMRVAT
jgi:hypothetical protein